MRDFLHPPAGLLSVQRPAVGLAGGTQAFLYNMWAKPVPKRKIESILFPEALAP